MDVVCVVHLAAEVVARVEARKETAGVEFGPRQAVLYQHTAIPLGIGVASTHLYTARMGEWGFMPVLIMKAIALHQSASHFRHTAW